eukprot:TRINITY_DN1213_c0_g1_i3.p1 TRINITY_DN1213_c0_g1~~TRINITY_DN1213_c0_g1_i3.p1  ORF type:complete len:103 (+),score=25.25 TRINITY_DN1213_c0_g1_i3:674-982(+)
MFCHNKRKYENYESINAKQVDPELEFLNISLSEEKKIKKGKYKEKYFILQFPCNIGDCPACLEDLIDPKSMKDQFGNLDLICIDCWITINQDVSVPLDIKIY